MQPIYFVLERWCPSSSCHWHLTAIYILGAWWKPPCVRRKVTREMSLQSLALAAIANLPQRLTHLVTVQWVFRRWTVGLSNPWVVLQGQMKGYFHSLYVRRAGFKRASVSTDSPALSHQQPGCQHQGCSPCRQALTHWLCHQVTAETGYSPAGLSTTWNSPQGAYCMAKPLRYSAALCRAEHNRDGSSLRGAERVGREEMNGGWKPSQLRGMAALCVKSKRMRKGREIDTAFVCAHAREWGARARAMRCLHLGSAQAITAASPAVAFHPRGSQKACFPARYAPRLLGFNPYKKALLLLASPTAGQSRAGLGQETSSSRGGKGRACGLWCLLQQ